jgi:pentose-5-phosphate-3-epimerase
LIIEIDGGVTPDNIISIIEAGADALVCGNGTIFRPHEDSIKNKVKSLKTYIDGI